MFKAETRNKLLNIIPIGIFIFLIWFFTCSPYMNEVYNNRCCEFEKVTINDTIHYATFGKSGNVFRLKSNKKKNYYFLNEGRFSRNPEKNFGDIARKGSRVTKVRFADTLFIYNSEKKYAFVIDHCCSK